MGLKLCIMRFLISDFILLPEDQCSVYNINFIGEHT